MSCCCEPESPYHKHLTALSGCLLLIGLIISVQAEARTSVALFSSVPDLAGAFLLAAAVAGGANFLPSGIRSLLSLSLDMDFLMSLALVAASLIGEFAEAAAIGFLFSLAELAEDYAVDRSRKALDALTSLEPESANVVSDTGEVPTPVENLRPGDVVAVRPGNRVPIDGEVVVGATSPSMSRPSRVSRCPHRSPLAIVSLPAR